MPSNLVSQIHRMVSASLNAGTGDALPGQSVSSGTGAQSYGGEVGARVALSSTDIRFTSAIGTLFGGIYQYVQTLSTSTAAPARGTIAFWDLTSSEALYMVTADAKPTAAIPTLIAGIFLNAIVKGLWGWLQIAGRASVLYDSTITAAAAGNPVSARISATVASTVDVGAASTLLSPQTDIGVAETLPVLSVISVVQLDSKLIKRI